jgi:ribosomal protein S18 acetylase RimI-like enzyme
MSTIDTRVVAVDHRPTLRDAAAVARLASVTFSEAFGHLYPRADLEAFLAEERSEAKYARLLRDPDVFVATAAGGGDGPVGYVLAGSCKLPVPGLELRAGEIRELYVTAGYQGRGLGTRLLRLALDWLCERERAPVYVGVWSQNLRAQRLYEGVGFQRVGQYRFPVGNHLDHEFIFKLELPRLGAG